MLRSTDQGWVDHYLRTGREAVALMQCSLASAGLRLRDVTQCLILPSGYGRVVRHLVREINPERITACDVDRQALRFCATEFGVRPLKSSHDLRHLLLPTSYDLVFIGSLLTHLPPRTCLTLLDKVAAALRPSGHLVFTTQGETCLEHLAWYGEEFVRTEETFREQVWEAGVAFVPYRRRRAYGITIHTRRYIEREMASRPRGLRLLAYRERGWDAHQDVWFYNACS